MDVDRGLENNDLRAQSNRVGTEVGHVGIQRHDTKLQRDRADETTGGTFNYLSVNRSSLPDGSAYVNADCSNGSVCGKCVPEIQTSEIRRGPSSECAVKELRSFRSLSRSERNEITDKKILAGIYRRLRITPIPAELASVEVYDDDESESESEPESEYDDPCLEFCQRRFGPAMELDCCIETDVELYEFNDNTYEYGGSLNMSSLVCSDLTCICGPKIPCPKMINPPLIDDKAISVSDDETLPVCDPHRRDEVIEGDVSFIVEIDDDPKPVAPSV